MIRLAVLISTIVTTAALGAPPAIHAGEYVQYQMKGVITQVSPDRLKVQRDTGGEQLVFITDNTVAVANGKVVEHPEYREGQRVLVQVGLVGRICMIEFIDLPKKVEKVEVKAAAPSFGSMPPHKAHRPPAEKDPVPSPEDQEKAAGLLRSVYSREYSATTLAEKRACPRKLLEELDKLKDDPIARYVMLRDALKFATDVGDVPAASCAIDELNQYFTVDAPALRSALVISVSAAPLPQDVPMIVDAGVKAVGELIKAGQYPAAERVLGVLQNCIVRAPKGEASALKDKLREHQAFLLEYDRAAEAIKRIQAGSADANSNLLAGRFYCFVLQKWDTGLPLLAKSVDPKLSAAAKADLDNPSTANDQFAVSRLWWEIAAEPATSAAKFRCRYWIEKALPGLSGLEATVARKRLSEIPGGHTMPPTRTASTDPVKPEQVVKPTEIANVKTYTNSIGMKFVQIEAGEFLMGSPKGEKERSDNEPEHHVKITKPYMLGQFEVTRGQFAAFVKDSGYKTVAEQEGWAGAMKGDKQVKTNGASWLKPGFAQTEEHPVVCMTYADATAFCHWLSKKEDRTYHLPTDAQWEYACRAGTRTAYSWGDEAEEGAGYANINDQSFKKAFPRMGRVSFADGYVHTAPVGSFKPNPWGLYDMHGNVWEWCADWLGELSSDPATDPTGPDSGTQHIWRGGSWLYGPEACRSARRMGGFPTGRGPNIGFRCALDIAKE